MKFLPGHKPYALPDGITSALVNPSTLTLEAHRIRHLAEHAPDLPTRCRYILRYLSQLEGKLVFGLSPQASAMLIRYPWSDGLNELESVLASAIQKCKGNVILPAHLPLGENGPAARSPQPAVGRGEELPRHQATKAPSHQVAVESGAHESTRPQVHEPSGEVEEPTVHSPQSTAEREDELPRHQAPKPPSETEGSAVHKSSSPQVHKWPALVEHGPAREHIDERNVEEIIPPMTEVEEPAASAVLPFVDLGLLSVRHDNAAVASDPKDHLMPVFHIRRSHRSAIPTARKVTRSNNSTDEQPGTPLEPVIASSSVDLPTAEPHNPPQTTPVVRPLREALEELERQLITQALQAVNQDIVRAAEMLSIPRQTLQYRMKALGIDGSPSPLAPRPSQSR